jgi:hypothetical protein
MHGQLIEKQKATFGNAFSEWTGKEDQTDDVLVIGIKC